MAKYGDCDNGTGYNIIAWYDNGRWLDDAHYDIEINQDYFRVTHWQPLPDDPISIRKERKLKLQQICTNLQK